MLLHGVQHDLTVNATVSRDGNNVTIHCDFVIPYVAWGLEDPSIMMFKVAKEVAIDISHRRAPELATRRHPFSRVGFHQDHRLVIFL